MKTKNRVAKNLADFIPPVLSTLWPAYNLLFLPNRTVNFSCSLPSSFWYWMSIAVALLWFILTILLRMEERN